MVACTYMTVFVAVTRQILRKCCHLLDIGLSAIHDVPCPLSDSMQAQTPSIEYYHYIMDLLQDIISTFFFLWTEIRNYFQAALEQGSQICDIITR